MLPPRFSMNEPDRIRLQHMLDAANEALSFVSNKSKENLASDRKLALAIIKEIEIIGEAAARISTETRSLHPSVPWPAMVGMRNRLIHGYADVDFDIVWSAVKVDLPRLIGDMKTILATDVQ